MYETKVSTGTATSVAITNKTITSGLPQWKSLIPHVVREASESFEVMAREPVLGVQQISVCGGDQLIIKGVVVSQQDYRI